jgi:hypothetical protein
MTTTFKYNDKSETITFKTGEVFTLQQDINGFWGYTSNKGYNSWEAYEFKTKAQAKAAMRELEKNEILNAKYE